MNKSVSILILGCVLSCSSSDTYFNNGFRFYNSGEFHKAKTEYLKALNLNDSCIHCYHNLGLTYLVLLNEDSANFYLDKAKTITAVKNQKNGSVTSTENSTPIHSHPRIKNFKNRLHYRAYQQALYLISKKHYNAALNIFKRIEEKENKNITILNAIGNTYMEMNKKEAKQYFQKSMAIDSNNSSIMGYINLACYEIRIGKNFDQAIELLESNRQLIANDFQYANFHYNLSTLYYLKENFTKAKESFDAIVPNDLQQDLEGYYRLERNIKK